MTATCSLVRRDIGALVFAAIAFLTLVPAEVRADAESTVLTKYRARVDRAVDRGLEFLARNQEKNPANDGSFTGQHGKKNAVVGLAGMAFLSKGHTPAVGPHSKTIRRCIDYILSTPATNGYLGVRGGQMYSHAIATLFLSEVSGMVGPVRQKRIDAVLPKALKVILSAQSVHKAPTNAGGWRYTPNDTSSDLSVTGWNLMALRSARLNGAPVPVEAIKKAVKYIDGCREAATGGFAYTQGSAANPAMTAVGLLCRELAGHHGDDVNLKAGDFLLKATKGTAFLPKGHREYATYYASQAMFQLGGHYWDRFAESMYEYLLPRQRPNGSWRPMASRVYATAMYTLALGVSYRQLPIHQR